jgi:hypothetical protein
MSYWILGFYVYLAAGLGLAFVIDRDEMKKDVPYGTFPAVVSLGAIRKIMIVMIALLGAPTALVAFIGIMILHTRASYFHWRMSRALRRMCKSMGLDHCQYRTLSSVIDRAIEKSLDEQEKKDQSN